MKKIVLITGATSGFGEAIARKFAANNFHLIITGRRNDRLQKLKEELENNNGIEVLPLCFDVRNQKAVDQALSSLTGDWKKINILVNNAGLAAGRNTIDKGNIEDWDAMIDTNLKGLLYVSKAIIPLLKNNNGGHIFNIGSIAGKETYKAGNVYCATKHAVDSLTKAMRIDLLPYRIKVTGVCPGAADTEFSLVRFKGDKEKAKMVYSDFTPLYAEDIADVVYFAATRPAHVCLNDIVMTSTDQANSTEILKSKK